MKQLGLIISGIILSGIAVLSISCQKDTDCRAKVSCRDSLGAPIANAEVILYAAVKDPNDPKGQATYTADVKANGNSDSNGDVSFVFKLPAIYDIRATSVVGTKTLVGTSIIKLIEGETVEKTVTVQ